jgi:hypothetical protein
VWPSAKYLTHRVKYALDQLTATFGPSSGTKHVSFPKRASGKERTQKLRNDWSKREMTDFYRVVSSYGIPFKRQGAGGEEEKDYMFIKEQAKLTQKTLDMIKQYVFFFIRVFLSRPIFGFLISKNTCLGIPKSLFASPRSYLRIPPEINPRKANLAVP